MPVYFFHLHDGVDFFLDDEGRELDSDAETIAIALREARSTISIEAQEGRVKLDQRIDVIDTSGRLVHRQRFIDAIDFTPPGPDT